MCGITLCIVGAESIQFKDFNYYNYYLKNPYLEQYQPKQIEDFYQNVIKRQLLINNVSINSIKNALSPRGPDSFDWMCQELNSQNELIIVDDCDLEQNIFTLINDSIRFTYAASVLHLRGNLNNHVGQPYYTKNSKNILLFNGEIYGIRRELLDFMDIDGDTKQAILNFDVFKNDTQQVFDIFDKFSNNCNKDDKYLLQIKNVFQCFKGDYAIIFIDHNNCKISISKDYFGKRSLLLGISSSGLCFSSQSPSNFKKVVLENDQDEEVDIVLQKYMLDYNQCLEKEWLEMPSNQVTLIEINNKTLNITCSQIFNIETKNLLQEKYFQINDFSQLELFCPDSSLIDIAVNTIQNLIQNSVKQIVQNIIEYKKYFCKDEMQPYIQEKEIEKTTNSHIAIMFSGGLDSTLLTLMINNLIPSNESIDLLSISFSPSSSDRKTSIQSYQELKKLNPSRTYNLILIDKTIDDISVFQQEFIKIIYPKQTHMDFNISIALNFASRGQGKLFETSQIIQTGSKIVISGLGADEIFGGYMRYWVAFRRGCYQELYNEMKFDLDRIWIRNLGRDDRSISSNGKEVRFPFLDLELIQEVGKMDFRLLTDFFQQKGAGGDKQILRLIAAKLGLQQCCKISKKAIQFGTALAKQLNKKTIGSHKKAKGTMIFQVD